MKRWATILVFCSVILSTRSYGQDWQIIFHTIEADKEEIWRGFKISPLFMGDSLSLVRHLNNLITEIRSDGYLLANLDSMIISKLDHQTEAWIYIGKRFKWANISLSAKAGTPEELTELGTNGWIDQEVSVQEFDRILKSIIDYSENRGYPFARVTWDSIHISGDQLSATLIYETGPLITYDSLLINGSLKIRNEFLASYLETSRGNLFRQQSIDEIPERLDALNYVEISEAPNITFQNEEAQISLDLKKKPSNRFDAIIGFLPNEIEDKSLLITGMVDLSLSNLFLSGKLLEFHWDRLQKSTQTLTLLYNHPNLLHSPLGMQADFFLYRQDTSFLNRKMALGFEYRTGRYGKVSLQSRWESSRLINADQYQDASTLPDLADYNISYLGLGFVDLPALGLNYRSKKKWGIEIEMAIGSKVIKENANLDRELYNEVNLESIQFSGLAALEGIFTFPSKPYAIYGKLSSGKLINDQLFLNDLFRLGGLKSIRGFNENSFYASEYITATIEAQVYFNNISKVFAFLDYGYLHYSLQNSQFLDHPLGTGIGISLESGNGLFSFVYALGKSEEQALSMRYSKIHFGYKAIF